MTLTLTIAGRDTLDNGSPATLRLDGHGAIIGRSAHADWSLPDPKNHVSSRHCEISYRDGVYLLSDRSTNGTFVNGAGDRLGAPHPIADGDRFLIGAYEVQAAIPAATPAPPPSHAHAYAQAPVSPAAAPGWAEWDTGVPADRSPGWGDGAPSPARPPSPALSDHGWEIPAPLSRPSAWSSDPREPAPPSASDIWGELAQQSAVRPREAAPLPDGPAADGGWGRVPAAHPAAPEPSPPARQEAPIARPPEAPAGGDAGWTAFLAHLGLPPEQLRGRPSDVLAAAGTILRRVIAGLLPMVEARARARAHLGLTGTAIELAGNNPLKFMRAPERALLALLHPPEPGFMAADEAIDDACRDLQAHQMSTIAAMRGALSETLARFSPAAIRDRRPPSDLLSRLVPAARDAALWRAYESEFEGVVRGADEAFMDRFAKEFRIAYERHVAGTDRPA